VSESRPNCEVDLSDLDVCVGNGSCRVSDAIPLACSIEVHILRTSIVNAVKQKLIRSMRLRSEEDFRPEQEEFSLSHGRFHHGRALVEILLSPRPAAAQRTRRVVPCHNL